MTREKKDDITTSIEYLEVVKRECEAHGVTLTEYLLYQISKRFSF